MNINYAESFNFKPIASITPMSGYWQNGTWKFNMPEITAGTGVSPSWQDIILHGNTALSLVNAKANSLEYLKLFGDTEQKSILPAKYQQLEYIETVNQSYIDTGIIPTINTKARVKFSPSLTTQVGYFGSRKDPYRFCCTTFAQGTTFSVGMTNDTWAQNRTNIVTGDIYDTTFANGYAIINGVRYEETPVTTFGETFAFKLGLISFSSSSYSTAKYYICQLWDNDVLTFNGIPAKRLSDDVCGMYDTVSNTFFINAGAGGTIVGGSATPTPETPIDIVCNNGAIKVSKNLFDYEYFYDNYQDYSTSAVGRCPIKLKPNITYTVSTNRNSSTDTAVIFVVSGSAIDWAPNTANNGILVDSPRTVTTDSNGYLCFGIYVRSDAAIPESDFISGTVWVQIEQGTTATTYMPYGQIYTDGTTETVEIDTTGDTATAENLFKVGTYQDVQSVIDGGVTRNVGIFVLDGTEPWVMGTAGDDKFCYFSTDVINQNTTTELFCSHYGIVAPNVKENNTMCVRLNKNGFLFTDNIHCVTNGSWAQYLQEQYAQGTPVTIVYPLAEPTTESVTAQPINIQAGTNIVEITQASIDNLELEVSYKAGVSVTITEIQNAQLDDNVEVTING